VRIEVFGDNTCPIVTLSTTNPTWNLFVVLGIKKYKKEVESKTFGH
jgi:hypothetical protein